MAAEMNTITVRARGYRGAAHKFLQANVCNRKEAESLTEVTGANGNSVRTFKTNTGRYINVTHNADGSYRIESYVEAAAGTQQKTEAVEMISTTDVTSDPNAPAELVIMPPGAEPDSRRDFGGTPIPARNAEPACSEHKAEEAPQATEPVKSRINEDLARQAHMVNRFGEYEEGSATREYEDYVAKARQIAEDQKRRVDTMYHDKIDRVLKLYEDRLAANLNSRYRIEASEPSFLVAGRAGMSPGRKAAQNRRRDQNYEAFQEVQQLIDKIKGIGTAGISADDKNAVAKLREKLDSCLRSQNMMKGVNIYYRKHRTLDGCDILPEELLEKIKADMASAHTSTNTRPFPYYTLANNNTEIRRLRQRIEELEGAKTADHDEWTFNGGEVVANRDANRLQVLFNEKPDAEMRKTLKSHGFRWSPKASAWQRQLTENAYRAARAIPELLPAT